MSAGGVSSASYQGLRIGYRGTPDAEKATAGRFELTTPWLGGETSDELFAGARPAGFERDLTLFRVDDVLLGYGSVPFAGDRVEATREFYSRLLLVTAGRHLCRVWSHVPQINDTAAGLENYRAFCQGRSQAFEEFLGKGFAADLSAASAVGCDGDQLQVVFAATDARPRHFENPEQVPAYLYPPEHGPRSPSFARASLAVGTTRQYVFVSGTSAIKGHVTVAPGKLEQQLDCTLDNLRLVSREVGTGQELGAGERWTRYFKVYLRHAEDLAFARRYLDHRLFRPGDKVTYLRSDICRAALNVEIEASLVRTVRDRFERTAAR